MTLTQLDKLCVFQDFCRTKQRNVWGSSHFLQNAICYIKIMYFLMSLYITQRRYYSLLNM